MSVPRNVSETVIPNWAAIVFAVGMLLAVLGFVSAWITDSGVATLAITIGLIAGAIGMRAGERAIEDNQNEA